MADANEEIIDLNELDKNINNKNAVEERMHNLAKGKKEAEEAKAQLEQKLADSEKENKFFSSFSDSIAKYPQAADFKDKIKEKVMAGYDVEDATVAILSREGKFTQSSAPQPVVSSPLGGSASTSMQNGGVKTHSEMSREEKRSALMEAEKRGDIGLS